MNSLRLLGLSSTAALAVLLSGCATAKASEVSSRQRPSRAEEGIASYYAASLEGRSTASGEPYRGARATCAHRTHRFGTMLRITDLKSGRSVVCRVNDRGPFVKGRVVDLSASLARELGIVEQGLAKVRVEVL